MGVFTSNEYGDAYGFSYLLRHVVAASSTSTNNSTVLAHVHATRLTTSADGVMQGSNQSWAPADFNMPVVVFPASRKLYTAPNVNRSPLHPMSIMTSGTVTQLKSGGLLMLINGAFAKGCAARGCTSLVAIKSNGTGIGKTWKYMTTAAHRPSSLWAHHRYANHLARADTTSLPTKCLLLHASSVSTSANPAWRTTGSATSAAPPTWATARNASLTKHLAAGPLTTARRWLTSASATRAPPATLRKPSPGPPVPSPPQWNSTKRNLPSLDLTKTFVTEALR